VYYLVQVLWQMVCVGVDRGDLAAFGRVSSDWRVYTIPRRERVAAAMVSRVRDWYERHIVEGRPPPIDGSDACGRALALRHGQPSRDWVAATSADVALAHDGSRAATARASNSATTSFDLRPRAFASLATSSWKSIADCWISSPSAFSYVVCASA
jgi:hypothetical protein